MKTLWILAAAATFAACHNRSDDETGAAPDRGDSTMTAVDTAMAQPSPSTSGYDTTSTTTLPSAEADTTMAPAPSAGYDTTSTTDTQNPSDQGYVPTTEPSAGATDTTGAMAEPSADVGADTTMAPSEHDGMSDMHTDSTLTNTDVPDTSNTQR
ncbi:MAG: hypothetical protein ABI860_06880 [Gemmatimonadales bacterium]